MPATIERQGAQMEQLSEKRLQNWLAAFVEKISKRKATPTSGFVLAGKLAKLYDTTNLDWVPTLNLGHCEAKTGDSLSRHDSSRTSNKKEKVESKRRKLNEEQAIAKGINKRG